MKTLKSSLIAIQALGFLALSSAVTADPGEKVSSAEIQMMKRPTPAELAATHCLICHGNMEEGKPMLAPPMAMVKMHYQGLDKKTFIKGVSSWVKAPDLAKSRMPGAINRFGLMPALPYPEADVTAIAKYLFETDFPMPGHGGRVRDRERAKHNVNAAELVPQVLPPNGKEGEVAVKGCDGGCGKGCAVDQAAAPKAGGCGQGCAAGKPGEAVKECGGGCHEGSAKGSDAKPAVKGAPSKP